MGTWYKRGRFAGRHSEARRAGSRNHLRGQGGRCGVRRDENQIRRRIGKAMRRKGSSRKHPAELGRKESEVDEAPRVLINMKNADKTRRNGNKSGKK